MSHTVTLFDEFELDISLIAKEIFTNMQKNYTLRMNVGNEFVSVREKVRRIDRPYFYIFRFDSSKPTAKLLAITQCADQIPDKNWMLHEEKPDVRIWSAK